MWALCFVRFFCVNWLNLILWYIIQLVNGKNDIFFVCYHEVDMYRINTYAHFTHCSKGHFLKKKHSSPSPYSTIAPIKLCFSHCNEFLEFFSQLVETFFFAVQRIRNWNFSLMHNLPLAIDNLILNFLCWFYTNHVLIALLQENVIWKKKKMKYR